MSASKGAGSCSGLRAGAVEEEEPRFHRFSHLNPAQLPPVQSEWLDVRRRYSGDGINEFTRLLSSPLRVYAHDHCFHPARLQLVPCLYRLRVPSNPLPYRSPIVTGSNAS